MRSLHHCTLASSPPALAAAPSRRAHSSRVQGGAASFVGAPFVGAEWSGTAPFEAARSYTLVWSAGAALPTSDWGNAARSLSPSCAACFSRVPIVRPVGCPIRFPGSQGGVCLVAAGGRASRSWPSVPWHSSGNLAWSRARGQRQILCW
eukprot:6483378-Pyramimonas_sp.AAC.1